ncbi:MAG: sigma 54-interacting transcriptional regulator [Gemmatimonadota bacterium]|nr:sigma 54-interacting transcriptional regulator [Gemmatimonadota bacterium]
MTEKATRETEPRPGEPVGPPISSYWEIGGHPNFLLSVDERVVDAREQLTRVSDTSLTVLLCGERGVGKEVLARGVHDLSERSSRPFVSLNCYAIPRSAIRVELFGRGAGGKVDQVDDGTLHVHGVELLPDELHERLVEWKRQRTDTGGAEPRLVLSCEQPSLGGVELAEIEKRWVEAGGVVRIEIPPLRDRSEDVALLANHILQKYSGFYSSKIKVLRSSFIRFLKGYRWPGNVRELERVIRRFLVIEDEEAIREELGSKRGLTGASDEELLESDLSLKEMSARAVERIETKAIERALAEVKWNKKQAAADLGISYKSLLNKVKRYEIEA